MKNLETALINYLSDEFETLNGRTLIATPESRENLESFAKANLGSMDILLMQMAIQYGYKIALQNLQTKFLLTEK